MPDSASEGMDATTPPSAAPPSDPSEVGPSPSGARPSELGLAVVLAMLASLLGIVGLAYSIYSFKFHGPQDILFLPSRVFFVFSLGLTVAPFLLVLLSERVPYLLVLLPTVVCFLLYPVLSPHGVVFGQDATFNFQFASAVLTHGTWVPGANTTDQAVTYSYFPGSGLFNAEGSVFAGIPLTSSFLWMLPLSRLLIVPTAVYALGSRLVGPRAGLLGVFFYLAAPSITFNDMVQQEFAIQFFILTIVSITFLLYAPKEHATALRLLVLVFSSFVILSHHLTSYVTGIWLAGLAVIPLLLWGKPMLEKIRSAAVAVRYLAFFLLFVLTFTAAILLTQLTVLEKNLLLLLSNAPLATKTTATGSSYPTYQLIWIILSLGILVLLGILTLRHTVRGKGRPYLSTSLVISMVILTISFILFATPYSFVAIRTTEYALVVAAPAAAWYLVRRLIPKVDRAVRPIDPVRPRVHRSESRAWIAPAVAIAIAFFVFSGGNLVPGLSRDQYQPTHVLAVNSPLHVTAAVFEDGVWARSHLNANDSVWGDFLVYDVYAGIGGLTMPFATYDIFNGTHFTANNTHRLRLGAYVVTDVYDTELRADFYGSSGIEPVGPLLPAQVDKFENTSHFSTVFIDSVFTVHQFVHPFYFVTFSEAGLPAGTLWSVTLGGSTESATNASMSFDELNGTYAYTVGAVAGYSSTPSSGNVTVAGSSPTVRVTFV